MSKKALFPISLSNQQFATKIIVPALTAIVEQYDECVFLVADRLQLYNRANKVDSGAVLMRLIGDFSMKTAYLEQRRTWLERLRKNVKGNVRCEQWTILGVDDVADAACFRILRNVILAFQTVPAFRDDVIDAARRHLVRRDDSSLVSEQLSVHYILEEIALSLRLHVLGDIEAEFYVGEHLLPVLKLYSGSYGLDVHGLAEADAPAVVRTFEFFDLQRQFNLFRWTAVGDGTNNT